jgi:hypothetical protein
VEEPCVTIVGTEGFAVAAASGRLDLEESPGTGPAAGCPQLSPPSRGECAECDLEPTASTLLISAVTLSANCMDSACNAVTGGDSSALLLLGAPPCGVKVSRVGGDRVGIRLLRGNRSQTCLTLLRHKGKLCLSHTHPVCPCNQQAVCGKRAKMEDTFSVQTCFFDLPASAVDDVLNKLPARIALLVGWCCSFLKGDVRCLD